MRKIELMFAFKIYWDTAYIRTMISYGFDTIRSYFEMGGIPEDGDPGYNHWLFRKEITGETIEEFHSIDRFILIDQPIGDVLRVYENMIDQTMGLMSDGLRKNASKLEKDMADRLAHHNACKAQMLRFDALKDETGEPVHTSRVWGGERKLTAEEIKERFDKKLPISLEDHPEWELKPIHETND